MTCDFIVKMSNSQKYTQPKLNAALAKSGYKLNAASPNRVRNWLNREVTQNAFWKMI